MGKKAVQQAEKERNNVEKERKKAEKEAEKEQKKAKQEREKAEKDQTIQNNEEKSSEEQNSQIENSVPCANPACKYQVTWHATHCCGGCARGKKHGPRCECKEVPQAETETNTNEAATKGEEMAIAEVLTETKMDEAAAK